ncbi:MAG: flagellar hook-basal body complex protein, partial [Planctomycetota bacterium]
MASTVALFTGLSGLNANSRNIEVVGNNIANSNTTAYKRSRLVFADSIKQTLRDGLPPTPESGGTNPTQIGLGVSVAGTQRDFTQGSVSVTGDQRDLAIEGSGFFVVERDGDRAFTRAGSFRQDEARNLVTSEGDVLLGYGVDDNFQIQEGQLQPLSIPIGARSIAEQTTQVRFSGNLNADGNLPASGTVTTLSATTGAGLSLIAGATVPPTPGNVLEATSLLTEIEDPLQLGSGTPLFAAGQIFEIDGARRAGGALPTAQLEITAASTVQDLMTFISQTLGIQQTGVANPDGLTPGVSLDPLTGALQVVGNTGSANDFDLPGNAFRVLETDGTLARLPFGATETANATGESVRTTFVVFDSLGSAIEVEMGLTLEATTDTGTTWRYFIDSADNLGDAGPGIATGTLEFDTFGQLLTTDPIAVSVNREGTGAVSPLLFNISLTEGEQAVTALADTSSEIAATFRDGRESGTLEDFSVGRDGTIVGTFSNGLFRSLGQVVIATFTNEAGLLDQGSN